MRIQICLHVTRYICNTVTSGRGVEDAGAGRKKKTNAEGDRGNQIALSYASSHASLCR